MYTKERERCYAICLKDKDGVITAIADYPGSMSPANTYCYLYQFGKNESIRNYVDLYKKKYPSHEVFAARIGSKNCPIEIEWNANCYRFPVNRRMKVKLSSLPD